MKKIKLEYPITHEERTISEIEMRRPKIKDQLAVDNHGSEGEKEIALVARLTNIPIAAVEEMDLYDYGQIQKELEGFLFRQTK